MQIGSPDAFIGQVIGDRYQVVRLIGKGAMGAVYEVQHLRVKRRYALKRLTGPLTSDDDALARFRREADAVAALRHANVVEIIDWEVLPDGAPCMIIELLKGEDLRDRLEREGPLEWTLVAKIADQVLSALTSAHRAGIVHRDLKPANIFLVRDDSGDVRVKLLDFGLSKIVDGDVNATASHTVIGTPAHMSPEQASGDKQTVGPASDIWSMGTILSEMATGRPAFSAVGIPQTLYQVVFGKPEPIAPFRADAPPAFIELVAKMLEKDPEQRIKSVEEVRARLRRAISSVAADPVYDSNPQFPAEVSGEIVLDSARVLPAQPRSNRITYAAIFLSTIAIVAVLFVTLKPSPPSVAMKAPPPIVPAPSATPVSTPIAMPPTPPAPAATDKLLSRTLDIFPRGAQAQLDGQVMSDEVARFADDGRTHTLQISAPGFHSKTISLDRATAQPLIIRLAKFVAPAPRATPPSPPPPTIVHEAPPTTSPPAKKILPSTLDP